MAKVSAVQKAESKLWLQNRIEHDQYVYVIIRDVTRSRMTRFLSYFIVRDGMLHDITWHVSNAWGEKPIERDGYWVTKEVGGGMDMAFNAVYNLSYMLFNDGYKLRKETI